MVRRSIASLLLLPAAVCANAQLIQEGAASKAEEAVHLAVRIATPHLDKSVKLGVKPFRAKSKINGVEFFCVVNPGLIAFEEEGAPDPEGPIILVNSDGKIMRRIELSHLVRKQDIGSFAFETYDPNHLLFTWHDFDHKQHARTWLANVSDGEIRPFQLPSENGWPEDGRFSDGSVVVRRDRNLDCISPAKKIEWTVALGTEPDSVPDGYGASDMSVDTNDRLLVLDDDKKIVLIYSRDGKLANKVDIKSWWPTFVDRPTSIKPDAAGGFAITDSSRAKIPGLPSVVRFDRSGNFVGMFHPHFSDGQPCDQYRSPEPDLNGRFWITDGRALYRVNNTGVVDRIVGEGIQRGVIESISAAALDEAGDIFLMDGPSKTLHAFSPDGTKKYVYSPAVSVIGLNYGQSIDAASDGTVHIYGGAKGEVVVDPQGRFAGFWGRVPEEYDLERVSLHSEQGKRWTWGRGPEKLISVVDNSGTVVANVPRNHPSEKSKNFEMIDHDLVSINGALCVVSQFIPQHPGDFFLDQGPYYIRFYDVAGDFQGSFRLPDWAGWIRSYDGTHAFAIAADDLVCFDRDGTPRWRCPWSSLGKNVSPFIFGVSDKELAFVYADHVDYYSFR